MFIEFIHTFHRVLCHNLPSRASDISHRLLMQSRKILLDSLLDFLCLLIQLGPSVGYVLQLLACRLDLLLAFLDLLDDAVQLLA